MKHINLVQRLLNLSKAHEVNPVEVFELWEQYERIGFKELTKNGQEMRNYYDYEGQTKLEMDAIKKVSEYYTQQKKEEIKPNYHPKSLDDETDKYYQTRW